MYKYKNYNYSQSAHPDYQCWDSMKRRCLNENHKDFKRYAAKGVKLHASWNDFWVFIVDMGPRPTAKHSIDRIDNKGNYEPGNCKWSTKKEQNDNRRIAYECVAGHPWTEQSTYRYHTGGRDIKICKICKNDSQRKSYHRNKSGK